MRPLGFPLSPSVSKRAVWEDPALGSSNLKNSAVNSDRVRWRGCRKELRINAAGLKQSENLQRAVDLLRKNQVALSRIGAA